VYSLPQLLLRWHRATTFITMSIKKGFNTRAGETRNGTHFTMKGVTRNTLDLKIGSADTDGGMAVFEQIGTARTVDHRCTSIPSRTSTSMCWKATTASKWERSVSRPPPAIPSSCRAVCRTPSSNSPKHARMLVTYQPAGDMEGFFAETAQWTAPPTKEEVARVFRAHGMEVVGPPLAAE
jgi:hypothetical protein